MNEPLAYANQKYCDAGFSTIPIGKDKRPVIIDSWTRFQKAKPCVSESGKWFQNGSAWGIAIIAGNVSGNIEVIDVDCKYDLSGTLWNDLTALIKEHAPGLLERLVIAKTVNNGFHLVFRSPDDAIQGNQKLAIRSATAEETKNGDKYKVLIETRGEGGYFAAEPTPGYSFIQGDIFQIPSITKAERDLLLTIARSFDQRKVEAETQETKEKQETKPGEISPFEDYNQRADIPALLEKHGWRFVYQRGERLHFIRPGTTDSVTSANFHKGLNIFYVFSTSTEFEAERGYNPTQIYTLLEHGGDYRAASRALYAAGYGTRRKSDDADLADDEQELQPRKTQATVLMQITEDLQLFYNALKECFAVVPVKNHVEILKLNNKSFKTWLSRKFYEKAGQTPNAQSLQDAINTLSGKALFDGECLETHVRVAEYDSAIFVDLGNDDWQAVRISADGWQIVESKEVPVKFRRTRGMLSLPKPETGGSLDSLRSFVNVREDDFILVAAWLVAALRPNKPCPCLGMHGEQGSAKSTTARACRDLIDPNVASLRSRPRDERDLMIAANNSWILSFDNLSNLSAENSDAICRVVTGGGLSTRELFTDDDEIIFNSMRPIIFNGIEELANRSDLLERSLILNLPRITEEKRKTEAEFWRDFEAAKPKIIGAIFDKVAEALRKLPAVKLAKKPRMADFAEFAFAAFGDEFINRYEQSRRSANETALEASPVALIVQKFMENREVWEGKASDLLKEFEILAGEKERNQKDFPKQPNALSGKLKRIAPNLRAIGIEFEINDREAKKRSVKLSKIDNQRETSSQTVASSQANKNEAENSDDENNESSQRSSQTITLESCDDVSGVCDNNEKRSSQFSTNKNVDCDDVTMNDDDFQPSSNEKNSETYKCENCGEEIPIKENVCPECSHDNTPPF